MPKTSYSIRDGFRVPVDASIVGAELSALERRKRGRYTPNDVVEAARAESSRLHACFEWDDTVAAEKHRLNQARYLIQSVVCIMEDAPDSAPQRLMVSVRDDEGSYFTKLSRAMKDVDIRTQVIGQYMADMKAFQRRYKDIVELADVFESMNAVLKKPKTKTRRSRQVAPVA